YKRPEVFIHLVRRNDDAGTGFLHFATYGWIEVYQHQLILAYFQSSKVSSSNTSSINRLSSPFACICSNDFSHPFRGTDFGFRVILPCSKISSTVSVIWYCSNNALDSLMPFEFPILMTWISMILTL